VGGPIHTEGSGKDYGRLGWSETGMGKGRPETWDWFLGGWEEAARSEQVLERDDHRRCAIGPRSVAGGSQGRLTESDC